MSFKFENIKAESIYMYSKIGKTNFHVKIEDFSDHDMIS